MEVNYDIEFHQLAAQIQTYNPKLDSAWLKKVYRFSSEAHDGQLRKSGEPYFQHCVEVAKILTTLHVDAATIAGGLLHDVTEDTEITLQEIAAEFGAEVAGLLEGVTGIRRLKAIDSPEAPQASNVENYIKMFLSVVKDIRVVLIKLADRLHNMRTLKYLPEKKRQEIVIETRNIYVPLANRLGLAKIKSELEDYIFKFLENEKYKELARQVNEKRQERENYIKNIIDIIEEKLTDDAVKAKVEGRPKSLYSIYRKSQNRNLAFDGIYDLFAIRIIVETLEDCYRALDLLNLHFEPCLDKFNDYIKKPKPNGYKSLHTVIRSKEQRLFEVQIRTKAMHQIAEEGIAAHWKYKEGRLSESDLDKYLVDFRQWLNQLAERAQEEKNTSEEVFDHLKTDFFKDEIFVYTPQGRLLKLPVESTPVDFAFAIHSDLGTHCLGAKINGQIVSLNHKLQSGDTVEIIESAQQKPNMDWIKFVRTSKAYTKIRSWFKESLFDQSRKLGETILQHDLKRFGLRKEQVEFEALAQRLHFKNAAQLCYAIGVGRIPARQIVNKISREHHAQEINHHEGTKLFLSRAQQQAHGVVIDGLDGVMIQFAKCCQPVPGERILGFVTKGNGVIVHRSNCKNIVKLMENPERNLEVNWAIDHDKNFLVRLQMLGQDRKNFLHEVSEALAKTDTSIVNVSINSYHTFMQGHFVVEIRNLLHLTKVINKVSRVNGVINVERLDGTGEPVADWAGVPAPSWTNAN